MGAPGVVDPPKPPNAGVELAGNENPDRVGGGLGVASVEAAASSAFLGGTAKRFGAADVFVGCWVAAPKTVEVVDVLGGS
jgi:hypothetical protein